MDELRQYILLKNFKLFCLTASSIPNQVHSNTTKNRLNEKVFNGDCTVDSHVCTGNVW